MQAQEPLTTSARILAEAIAEAEEATAEYLRSALDAGEQPVDLRNAGDCCLADFVLHCAELHALNTEALDEDLGLLEALKELHPTRWAAYVAWMRDQTIAALIEQAEAQARQAVREELDAEQAAARETLCFDAGIDAFIARQRKNWPEPTTLGDLVD